MRGENDLIQKIQELKSVKPNAEWVSLTKKEILRDAPKMSFSFFLKPALAGTLTLCLFGSVFVFAQTAIPGDSLYPFKKVIEKTKISFLPEEKRPSAQLEYANDKLEDLFKVVEKKETEKVSTILKEYQLDITEAAQVLVRVEKPDVEEIVDRAKKIENNKKKIEALGVKVQEVDGLDTALSKIVEKEIEELEKASLSDDQKEILEKIRESYQNKDYCQALEKILLLGSKE